jgi:uncharacterized protein (DUF1697 family)
MARKAGGIKVRGPSKYRIERDTNPGCFGGYTTDMAVVISMLRGVNLLSHNRIRMEALRALYGSLGLRDAQSYVVSGNVVFRTKARNLTALSKRIEDAIERNFGFRPRVIVRTPTELRDVVARNPFRTRRGIEPNKLLVTFLESHPAAEALEQVLKIKADPEELYVDGREVYIYFPNGMGRSKLSWVTVEKKLKTSGTGRNWNSVTKLLEIAETLEAAE